MDDTGQLLIQARDGQQERTGLPKPWWADREEAAPIRCCWVLERDEGPAARKEDMRVEEAGARKRNSRPRPRASGMLGKGD